MSVISMLNTPYPNQPRFAEGAAPAEEIAVEITDKEDRPLLVLPRSLALEQQLPRRLVQVCLKDARGRIFLQKRTRRSHSQSGLWDLSVTEDIRAGESAEGAALRALQEHLGISAPRLKARAVLPYRDVRGALLKICCFTAGPLRSPLRPDPEQVSDGMFVDRDELKGLAARQAFLLSFELLWAIRSGWIF